MNSTLFTLHPKFKQYDSMSKICWPFWDWMIKIYIWRMMDRWWWTMKMHFEVFAFVLSICLCCQFFSVDFMTRNIPIEIPMNQSYWIQLQRQHCYTQSLSITQIISTSIFEMYRQILEVQIQTFCISHTELFVKKVRFDKRNKNESLFVDNFKWHGINSFNAWM